MRRWSHQTLRVDREYLGTLSNTKMQSLNRSLKVALAIKDDRPQRHRPRTLPYFRYGITGMV